MNTNSTLTLLQSHFNISEMLMSIVQQPTQWLESNIDVIFMERAE